MRQQKSPISTLPIISQWQQKTWLFVPRTIDAIWEIWLESASEMSFENDDGRTTEACLYCKLTYEPSAQVS